jgi:hypothetical protein
VTDLAALQAALAAEQTTIYGYGVSGAILTGSDRDDAMSALDAHQVVRDRLGALITAMGATPVAARPAYQLPFPVATQTAARELAGQLEQGCAGALWDLIAASPSQSPTRALAIGWLSDSAVRAAHWGAQQALPGQPA